MENLGFSSNFFSILSDVKKNNMMKPFTSSNCKANDPEAYLFSFLSAPHLWQTEALESLQSKMKTKFEPSSCKKNDYPEPKNNDLCNIKKIDLQRWKWCNI